jgi:hypothetical protein
MFRPLVDVAHDVSQFDVQFSTCRADGDGVVKFYLGRLRNSQGDSIGHATEFIQFPLTLNLLHVIGHNYLSCRLTVAKENGRAFKRCLLSRNFPFRERQQPKPQI